MAENLGESQITEDDGGNYTMIDYENFQGHVELHVEYETAPIE